MAETKKPMSDYERRQLAFQARRWANEIYGQRMNGLRQEREVMYPFSRAKSEGLSLDRE